MKRRDLTEIIGRRDARAISRALNAAWDTWGRNERPDEASTGSYFEKERRRKARLARLGISYA